MKSYYQHLKSTQEYGEQQSLIKKPILRSSAIFPVIKNEFCSSSIHFLGYWLLKRNIHDVALVITLRNTHGEILVRKIEIIDVAKAFVINLDNLLDQINYDKKDVFIGSIETEFNTTRDMVFPYPALVLEYHNENFNTCVHTLGRIFNDIEDLKENNESVVPETGFDIHATNDLKPFLSFVNGPIENNNGHIEYVITNSKSEKFHGDFEIGKIHPFETKLLFLDEHISNLPKILSNQSGSISIKHNFEGFYPRFLVGNVQKSFPSVGCTHSYYDCTSCVSDTDYWSRQSNHHHDASIYIPIFQENNKFTKLILYPNLSPSEFTLQIDIHDKNGKKVFENPDFLTIKNTENKLLKIDFNKILQESKYNEKENLSANIIANFKNNKIPSRIKFGLDVGTNGLKSKLPCNICFNMKMGNPLIENKPGSFHWAPIFNNRNTVLTLGNFSTLKKYEKIANIELNFYRIEDSSFHTKKISLKPNCETRLSMDDSELNKFLKSEGWVTVKADNPYIQGFYFNFNTSGSVAGDHFF